MKNVHLGKVMRDRQEVGVIKMTFKGRAGYIVRIKGKVNTVTVARFKTKGEAEAHYQGILDGTIIPNTVWDCKK